MTLDQFVAEENVAKQAAIEEHAAKRSLRMDVARRFAWEEHRPYNMINYMSMCLFVLESPIYSFECRSCDPGMLFV